MATRSLIRNPVANMRCACKASENPPRSLIRDQSSIVDTRVGVMWPLLILSIFWGPLRTQGLHSNSAQVWAPERVRVMWPLLILSPFLGTPKNARDYIAILPSCGLPRR